MRPVAALIVAFTFLPSLLLGQQVEDRSWQTGKWTEGDKEFKAARKQLEALWPDKKKLDGALASYTSKVKLKGATSLTMYCWAYSVLLRGRGDYDFAVKFDNDHKQKEPYNLFPSLSRPKNFEFTRVRWMFTASYDFPARELIPLGELIVEKDGSDIYPMLNLLKLYQPQINADQRKKGETLVRKLDRLDPDRLSVLTRTGNFYYLCWRKSKSVADANEVKSRLGKAYKLSTSTEQKRLIQRDIDEVSKK